jgi:iron complex outermembrane receptor protein
VAAVLGAGSATVATAQQSTSPAAPAEPVLEEVVVTAQRREENLQTTALAITALSGTLLEARNIDDIFGYADLAPSLTVNPIMGSATAASTFIRGQGVANWEAYVDSPVAIYIDGVLHPRPGVANLELADIERVEILSGPQGTLFGRNTTGGALNITTRAPTDEFGFQQTLQYGSDSELIAKSIVNTGTFGDSSWKAKLVYLRHERDGYVENISRNATFDAGFRESDSIWVGVYGDLTDRLSLQYRFDATKLDAVMPASQMVIAGQDILTYFGNSPALGGEPLNISPDRLDKMYMDVFGPESSDSYGHALTLEYEVSEALTIRNLAAYRESLNVAEENNTTGQGALLGVVLDPVSGETSVERVRPFVAKGYVRQRQLSNELQFIGEVGRFKYAAGLYYFEEHPYENNPLALTAVLPGGQLGINVGIPREFELETESMAVYAQGRYRPAVLDDKLEITLGARYTEDDRSIIEPTLEDSDSWSKASYEAALQYAWTPAVMTYFRFATAYKAGGFTPGFVGSYDPENADLYELGVKSDLFDNRLRVNASVYRTDYKDLQLQQTIGGIPVVTNAGESTFTGAEIEITAAPTARLRATASLGYIDPDYKVYMYSDPIEGNINVADEVRLTYSPELQWAASLVYDFMQKGSSAVTGRVDYDYQGRRYYFPLDRQLPYNQLISGPPFHNLSARLSWDDFLVTDRGSSFSISVWGNNLLDEEKSVSGTDWTPLDFATVVFSRPRTYGVGLDMRF